VFTLLLRRVVPIKNFFHTLVYSYNIPIHLRKRDYFSSFLVFYNICQSHQFNEKILCTTQDETWHNSSRKFVFFFFLVECDKHFICQDNFSFLYILGMKINTVVYIFSHEKCFDFPSEDAFITLKCQNVFLGR